MDSGLFVIDAVVGGCVPMSEGVTHVEKAVASDDDGKDDCDDHDEDDDDEIMPVKSDDGAPDGGTST